MLARGRGAPWSMPNRAASPGRIAPDVEYGCFYPRLRPVLQIAVQNNDLVDRVEYLSLPLCQPVTGQHAYSTAAGTGSNSMSAL